jgi:hypothetical protein
MFAGLTLSNKEKEKEKEKKKTSPDEIGCEERIGNASARNRRSNKIDYRRQAVSIKTRADVKVNAIT